MRMRFTIQREAFLKPLKAVAGVVERRSLVTHPILSNVLIEVREDAFSLTTTDQEVELVASGRMGEGPGEGEIGKTTVPLRKILDICRALPGDATLTLHAEQDKVLIRSGRGRFTLSSLPAEQFPSLTETKSEAIVNVSNKALKGLIDATAFAMAEQDVRYYLNGMLLEVKEGGLYAVAADGHRLAQSVLSGIHSDAKKSGLRVIVPRKGVLELQRILEENDEILSLKLGTHHLCIATENVTLTTKLLEGKFPDYERIIPQEGDKVVIGKRSLLKDAFLRASALFTDKSRGVKLRLSSGHLNILATNIEQDEVEEDLEVDYQGEDLEIGFNVRYLIDFLSVIEEDWIKFTFTNANSSARVEGIRDREANEDRKEEQGSRGETSQVYVIMPMRI